MKKRQYFIYVGVLIGLLALCSALWYLFTGGVFTINNDNSLRPIEDPLDVTLDFYNDWLAEAKANGTVAAEAAILNSVVLATSTRDTVREKISGTTDGFDPVLCQMSIPDKIGAKVVHQIPTEMEAMVVSRYASSSPTGFALVKLSLHDQTWFITDISCSRGDVLDDREFTFEQAGQLLKSVPQPLDSNFWHLVFTENGTPGHAVPLYFSPTSRCIASDGSETVCDPATFTDADDVMIHGTMTETGVEVAQLTFTN